MILDSKSERPIGMKYIFTSFIYTKTHTHAYLYERIKMDRHRVLAHFYDVILIYIDTRRPAIAGLY